MTFAGSHDIGRSRATPLSTEIIRWIPSVLRAIALVAVLAIAATVDWPDTGTSNPQADHVTNQPATSSEPVFDGRGKWTGYAR